MSMKHCGFKFWKCRWFGLFTMMIRFKRFKKRLKDLTFVNNECIFGTYAKLKCQKERTVIFNRCKLFVEERQLPEWIVSCNSCSICSDKHMFRQTEAFCLTFQIYPSAKNKQENYISNTLQRHVFTFTYESTLSDTRMESQAICY